MKLSIVGVAVADLTSVIISWVIYFLFVRLHLPEVKISLKFVNLATFKELLSYSLYIMVAAIFARLILSTDNIIIGRFVSLTAVTAYAIVFQIVEIARQIVLRVGRVFLPVYSRNQALHSISDSRHIFLEISTLSVGISSLLVLSLALGGGEVIGSWVGPSHFAGWPVLWVFCFYLLCQGFIAPAQTPLLSTDKYRVVVFATAVEGVLNLVLSLILVVNYGILGVALATLISVLSSSFWLLPLQAIITFHIRVQEYFKRVSPPFLVAAVLCGLGLQVKRHWTPSSIFEIIIFLFIISVFYVLAYWFWCAGAFQQKKLLAFASQSLYAMKRVFNDGWKIRGHT